MQSTNNDQENKSAEPKSDRWNVCVLFVLYMLQGIPRGLCHAIPLLLQQRKISYTEQALYDLTSLPGTFKLLWAPIVDCVYFSSFGKRKTWIIPTQLLVGLCLFYTSFNIENWIGSEDGSTQPNILPLAIIFFICNILLATQDIATDGWALTMLQRKNIGYQGVCNSIGIRAGFVFGYVVFILLNSKDFCNQYLRHEPKPYGMLMLNDFMRGWSIVLIVITILILIFKSDNSLQVLQDNTEIQMGIVKSYKYIFQILRLRPFRTFCYVLLVCKVFLGPLFGLTMLKLIDVGVTPDKLVLISLPLIPIQTLLPFFLKRCFRTAGSLERFTWSLDYMMATTALSALLIYVTPLMKDEDGRLPILFYAMFFVFNAIEHMILFMMHTSFLAFAANISDPTYGGTYLTLVNTVNELGVKWPVTLSLWLVDYITILSSCTVSDTALHSMKLTERQKKCHTVLDGYYVEIAISILFSFIWLHFGGKKIILSLQDVDESEWRVKNKKKNDDVDLEKF